MEHVLETHTHTHTQTDTHTPQQQMYPQRPALSLREQRARAEERVASTHSGLVLVEDLRVCV